jgi:hypothetical protein
MSWKDADFKKFARLRGLEERSGWVKWGEIFALSLFLAGFILLVTDKMSAAAEIIEPAPYTGVIKNQTTVTLSVPSANSDATLTIPPGGWIEYRVWKPEFDLTAYVNGNPYKCQRVLVAPHSFRQLCTNYDFVAEIKPVEPPACPPQKRKYYKKKPRLPGGVEAYG